MEDVTPRYYASLVRKGELKFRDVPGSVGVLGALDEKVSLPIGQGDPAGPDGNGVCLWRLTVHKQPLEGLWRLVGGEFRPAEQQAMTPGYYQDSDDWL